MATISSLGIGSGIDVRALVDGLVEAERAPQENRIQRQESRIEAQISGLGILKNGLTDFGKALDNVRLSSNFRQVDARVADGSVLGATAQSNAPAGGYDVEVIKLAQSQRLATTGNLFSDINNFSSTRALGAGEVSIRFGSGAGAVTETFTLSGTATSLDALSKEINEQSSRVRASILDDGSGPRLVFTSTQTGDQNAISRISVDAADPGALLNRLAFDASTLDGDNVSGGFVELRKSQNAEFTVDGMLFTRPTNEVSGAIEGVTLSLTREGAATRVTVAENPSTASDAIRGFVDAYNALRLQLNELGAYNPETKEAGLLNGDATLRTIQSRMAQALGNPVAGMDGDFKTLADMGIVSQKDGTLQIDDARLNSALEKDRAGVIRVFTDPNDGMATRMSGMVREFTAWDSILNIRGDNLQKRLTDLADARTTLDVRMERIEARYIAQFTAMDAMIAQMNQTSEFLDNQMMIMSANTRKR
ncbi:flagellar filament capping protein FliD [Ectothiorhodospira lacustris]|uniref:flagellar filament capping protein FliD n=1 Tax=Ectothiorhodospira lacustris TaxID=2899127 RepID=UPI001EE79E74|nr:flagellar filament capping protein FliD [Ectothiorhodospira lacustris]MCG5510196.1 flagellar filament capping protein FliD [Ectothiorhodospira lacustris]MCG5522039.1 flagellar filament capping protein FliD [Ectothiorhodospira lacustris]